MQSILCFFFCVVQNFSKFKSEKRFVSPTHVTLCGRQLAHKSTHMGPRNQAWQPIQALINKKKLILACKRYKNIMSLALLASIRGFHAFLLCATRFWSFEIDIFSAEAELPGASLSSLLLFLVSKSYQLYFIPHFMSLKI